MSTRTDRPAHSSEATPLSIGQCVSLACLLEATVPKPGNVHRGADFEDVTFLDFAISAVAIAPALEQAQHTGVGTAVLEAVRATRRMVNTNTNLGTVLLLAPLACAHREQSLREAIPSILAALTPQDAASIYAAIRVAVPGGMGKIDAMDVAEQPPHSILDAMRDAAQRDLVARQYANEFSTVLDEVVPALTSEPQGHWSLPQRIIQTQLQLMSRYPDSLIERKCGASVAQESAARASRVLYAGPPDSDAYVDALSDFDFWLRSDHHRRNPGTTADLIAAGLFVVFRDGLVAPPYQLVHVPPA